MKAKQLLFEEAARRAALEEKIQELNESVFFFFVQLLMYSVDISLGIYFEMLIMMKIFFF